MTRIPNALLYMNLHTEKRSFYSQGFTGVLLAVPGLAF